jgi:hypothetical protein
MSMLFAKYSERPERWAQAKDVTEQQSPTKGKE